MIKKELLRVESWNGKVRNKFMVKKINSYYHYEMNGNFHLKTFIDKNGYCAHTDKQIEIGNILVTENGVFLEYDTEKFDKYLNESQRKFIEGYIEMKSVYHFYTEKDINANKIWLAKKLKKAKKLELVKNLTN